MVAPCLILAQLAYVCSSVDRCRGSLQRLRARCPVERTAGRRCCHRVEVCYGTLYAAALARRVVLCTSCLSVSTTRIL